MSITKSLRGADIKVYINGKIYPPITSFRWNATTGRHAITGIDQSTPFELASGQCSIKGTFEILRIRGSGGVEGAGIATPESHITLERYFSISVVDRLSDTVILQINEASIIDQNWQSPARGVLAGAITFEGMGWVNEIGF